MAWLGKQLNEVRLTLLVAMLFTALAAMVFRNPPIVFMAALLWAVPFTVPLLSGVLTRRLNVLRRVPGQGTLGELLTCEITVINRSRLPSFLVHVQSGVLMDDSARSGSPPAVEAVGDRLRIFPLLRPGQCVSFVQKWRLHRRGVHHLGPARAGALDPLAVFGKLDRRSTSAEVLVLPRVHRLERLGFLQDGSVGSQLPRYATAVADAMDFHGVRQWVPGESMRRLHWKSTARTGKLHVVEWEESLLCDVALVLDTQRAAIAGDGLENSLETAISIAASVAMYLLEADYLCQLLFWQDEEPARPRFAPGPRPAGGPRLVKHEAHSYAGASAMLESLARIEPVDRSDADLTSLAQRVADIIPGDRATLMIASTLAEIAPAMGALTRVRRASIAPRAIVLDAESFGAGTSRAATWSTTTGTSNVPAPETRAAGRVRLVRLGDSIGAALEQTF